MINNVQTKAAKYVLPVRKITLNVSVRGDLGLTTRLTQQKLSCIRLKCKLVRTDDDRLTSKVAHWASHRRNGWRFQVDIFICEIDASDVVTNVLISVKTATRIIQNKLCTLDQNQFVRDLNGDRRNINGKKLRTYRLYKTSVQTEHYVSCQLPRNTRRTMALFRSGALPLAVETGRYSRPPILLNERLCKFCNTNSVENEIHFLMLCPLYSDIRYELFQKALEFINNFNMMNVENKFIELMNCDKIQIVLAHTLHIFFYTEENIFMKLKFVIGHRYLFSNISCLYIFNCIHK